MFDKRKEIIESYKALLLLDRVVEEVLAESEDEAENNTSDLD